MGAYELIELDKYAMLLAIRWLNGKLISNQVWIDLWLDKFIRWHLVSGLNGYMSYGSIQTS